jgi:cytochrome c oxidase subunit I+III
MSRAPGLADHPACQDDPEFREAQEERLRAAWLKPTGWRVISAVNNDTVGVWYTATALAFFLLAGVLGLLIRVQLAAPANDFLSAEFFNQAYTLHGTAMMFLFAVPIFEAVAILLLPELLGARDLPFPRLSAFGYWCFLIGGVFVMGSILFDAAPASGWFMYTPLSSDPDRSGIGVDVWLLGLSFIEVASIAAAVELIVGVLKCRPPGMRLNLMPLYCWYILVVAGMILFAFPPLIAGDLLLEMARAFDWPFFDAERGGDPILWQHLFWLFGHPEVYIIFLPSIALIATIIPTFARTPMVGHSWIILSAVGTAFLSFGLWAHHMFTTGLPNISLGFFSAASEAVAIPTGVQIFCFIATLLVGRATKGAPMLFAGGALAIFVFGGLTGVMVAIAPFDWQAHDSYFIVAHLHYTLFGGVVFPLIAGLYYFYPFQFERKLSERLGRIAFWLMFSGFNIAFLPMHWVGLMGMPRRLWTYPGGIGFDIPNLVSTIGAFILAAGVAVIVWDVLRPKRGPLVARNVWGSPGIEWAKRVPGESWGARTIPLIRSRYPLWEQENILRDIDEGRFYLPDAEEGRRELIVSDILDADPMQVQRVPGPTFLTLLAAAFLGTSFIVATYHWWWMAGIAGALFLATLLRWLWTGTGEIPEKPGKDVGLGLSLPLYASGRDAVGWWAMFITMIGDMTAFTGLVFSYAFFWTASDAFPPDGAETPSLLLLLLAAALAVLSWGMLSMARRRYPGGEEWWGRIAAPLAAAPALASVAAFAGANWAAGLDPTESAYAATCWVLVLWLTAHFGAGIVMQFYVGARVWAGRMDPRHDAELRNVALYWDFMLVTALVVFALLGLFPLATGG